MPTEISRAHVRVVSRPGVQVFLVAFALVYAAMALYALAMPLVSGPDEPTHVMHAAAVDRGELLGSLVDGPSSPIAEVHLPEFYAHLRAVPDCYHRDANAPASCAPVISSVCGKVVAHTPPCGVGFIYDARYPPLYYAVVGLPSLLGSGDVVLYLMRLWSAIFVAGFVALAFAAVLRFSRTRILLLGLIVAVTPMVVYLGGTINPSSLEIATGLCAWTSGLLLFREHLGDPPAALVVICAVSSTTLVLTRGLSPLWLALVGLVLLGVHEPGSLRAFAARRSVRIAAAVIVVATIAALVWTFKEHALLVTSQTAVSRSVSRLVVLEHSFAHNDFYLPDMVGVFGTFDTWAPTATYVIWYAMAGFVLIAAAVRANRRERVVLALVVAAVLCVPVAISSSQAYRYGYTWQGRDTLPFAVGLPLVAAVLFATVGARDRRAAAGVLGVLAGLAQFGAFFEALRRYTVGTSGPDVSFLWHSSWHPPLPALVLVVGEALVLAVGYALVARASTGAPDRAATNPESRERAGLA